MIRRSSNPSGAHHDHAAGTEKVPGIPKGLYQEELMEALEAGVEALNDPDIATRVEAYCRENPTHSRDAVHVAAVACRLKKEVAADRQHRETSFRPPPG